MLPVELEHRDKILGALACALGIPEALQEPLKALRPHGSPFFHGLGRIKSPWTPLQQIQVVVRLEDPFVVPVDPFVARNPSAVVKDVHLFRPERKPHLEPRISGRDRIVVLVRDDCAVVVHLAGLEQFIGIGCPGQSQELVPFLLEALPNG
jgi:hypothetical protein